MHKGYLEEIAISETTENCFTKCIFHVVMPIFFLYPVVFNKVVLIKNNINLLQSSARHRALLLHTTRANNNYQRKLETNITNTLPDLPDG